MCGRRLPVAACAVLMLLMTVASCGDKKDDSAEDANKTLLDIARRASQDLSLEEEAATLHEVIQQAGFERRSYERFPSQEVGKQGRVLIYADKKKSGGIIYVKKTGNTVSPGWHWYFSDMVPDSVVPVEINEDGLWDLRIVSTKGRVERLIQDESFSLTARAREDWIALNGGSSPPATENDAMWKCFDGDTATAWRSSAGGGEVYLELVAPFGIKEGVLTLQTMETDQPRTCTVFAEGTKIQKVDLAPAAARQMIRLENKVVGAKRVRLVFDSTAESGTVAIAEVALK